MRDFFNFGTTRVPTQSVEQIALLVQHMILPNACNGMMKTRTLACSHKCNKSGNIWMGRR